MYIKLEIDTREPISESDKAVLLALAGAPTTTIVNFHGSPVSEPDDADTASTSGPALAAVPDPVEPPKRTRRTKAQIAADEAAAAAGDAPAASNENPAAADFGDGDAGTDDGYPTVEETVAAASALLATKQHDKVREALAAAGAERVSEVAADKRAAFIAALQA